MVQEPPERWQLKETALNLLDDFAGGGVKGVSLISDGSTLSKAYVHFSTRVKSRYRC